MKLKDIRFSLHAQKIWQQKTGTPPSSQALRRLLRQSVRIQDYRDNLGRPQRFVVLAIYWHRAMGLAIKVNCRKGLVVTVIQVRE